MQNYTLNRPPDWDTREWRNVSWSLLARTASSGRSRAGRVQPFDPGGAFAELLRLDDWPPESQNRIGLE